jgi:hypothetical protein
MSAPRPAPSPGRPAATAVPEGWRPGPPDYVGIGAPGSRTSWWHGLILRHPHVALPTGRPGELHFFDDGWRRAPDETDLARYHAMFPRPPGSLAGEWTPTYLQQVWTPPLLRRAAPDARLLVVLRDPVARFRADMAEPRDRPGGSPTPRAAANAAFSRGLYADQLLRLWRAFPREQVLVLQLERCVSDPRRELERTFTFLGLPPHATSGIDPDSGVIADAAADPAPSDWSTEQLARHYETENARLAELLPDLELALWRVPR